MARKAKSAPKTVKLNTVVTDPVITPHDDAAEAAISDAVSSAAKGAAPVEQDDKLRKKEFFERVLTKTDVKRRDAKPAVEAALAVIAEALLNEEEIILPPLGKLRVVKSKDVGDGAHVMTIKLRTMKDGAGQGAADTSDEA